MGISPNPPEPTKRQVRAVNNIISGEYKTKADALRAAGYSEKSATHQSATLFKNKGIQTYLRKLNRQSRAKFGVALPDKVAMTYLEGLEATKLFGKDAVEHPDWQARKQFADSFAEFFGWKQPQLPSASVNQQFNFFSIPEKDKERFNNNFKSFLGKYYGQ